MYHIGDVLVYGTEGVCEVKEITEVRFGKETNEYYVLCPLNKETDTFYVPTSSEKVLLRMRSVISKEEASKLVDNSEIFQKEWIENERERADSFKKTLLYGSADDVMSMTKNIYAHQIDQLEKGKKLHASDERFLKDAEKLLLGELSYVLKITEQEILSMIIKASER